MATQTSTEAIFPVPSDALEDLRCHSQDSLPSFTSRPVLTPSTLPLPFRGKSTELHLRLRIPILHCGLLGGCLPTERRSDLAAFIKVVERPVVAVVTW